MSHTSSVLVPLIAAGAIVSTIAAQGPKSEPQLQLTPRELFYWDVKAAPQKASPKAPPKTKSAPTHIAPGVHNPAPEVNLPGGSKLITVTDPAKPPLVLKYTVLADVNSGEGIPADTIFHAGDHIWLKVETSGPGYLYVVNQGSSGTWKVMFPTAEVANGDNRVERGHEYLLPSRDRAFGFDQHTGKENVMIVFSREPVADLEELIYSLQNKPRPAADKDTEKQIVAQANIDDARVGRLRSAWARDLIIEEVNAKTPAAKPGEKKETAVYVASAASGSDVRVVADLHLEHR